MNKKIREAQHDEISASIKSGAYETIRDKRKNSLYYGDIDEESGEVCIHTTYALKNALNDELGLEFRLYDAKFKRKGRVIKRVERMISTNHAYFLTLTFSDKMFARGCSSETRRRYISRFLREQCRDYLANIDFGSHNEREHYHAVVIPKGMIDFQRYRDLFDSNINCKRIYVGDSSVKLVSRYIAKLSNHALKENGYYKRLIFCRNKAQS